MVVLNNGRILVCDSNNQCVQVAITIGYDVVEVKMITSRCSVQREHCSQDGGFAVEVLDSCRGPLALLS